MSKKLVQINTVCNGSTGRIMMQIHEEALKNGYESYCFYGRGKPANDKCYKIGNKFDFLIHVFITRIFNKHGHGSKIATKKLIRNIKKINPDIIQLHNIHGYYINMKILSKYLRKCNKKIIWTLHDCWVITGHCTYFSMIECEKWKNCCKNCMQKKEYPKSYFLDTSKAEFKFKKETFTRIPNLQIVVPSEWLKKILQHSYLKEYKINVINNGLDLKKFTKSTEKDIKRIKEKYGLTRYDKIILGVASEWNKRKGLEDFLTLSKKIDKDMIIFIVGLNQKQIKQLPKNIIGIPRTENIDELVACYSMSNFLFNPSREETFSLVTIEAMACGIPVIAYDNSAVKELINKENGYLLKYNENIEENMEKIIRYLKTTKDLQNSIKNYNIENMTRKYIKLYNE